MSFYLFPIIANLTSIPVNSIFQRLNLVEQGYHPLLSTTIAVALPWLIAVFLYAGSGYDELVTWSGVCVTSVVNFIIPPTVYIVARRQWQREQVLEAERMARAQQAGGDEVLAGRVLMAEEGGVEEVGSVQYDGMVNGGEVAAVAGVPQTNGAVDVVDSSSKPQWQSSGDRVWRVLPKRYARWELPLSIAVLLMMSALCGLTFVVNVQQAATS